MKKILKTDLFRLFRTKAFYVYPIFLVIVVIIEMVFAVKLSSSEQDGQPFAGGTLVQNYNPEEKRYGEDQRQPDYINDTDEIMHIVMDTGNGGSSNFYLQPGQVFFKEEIKIEDKYVKLSLPLIFDSLSDGLLLLFLGITLVIFATSETKNGFIKNAVGCVRDRIYMPVSKMIIGVVIFVVFFVEKTVITLISSLLKLIGSGKTLKVEHLPEGDVGRFIGFVLGCVLVHLAIIALLVMIHELTFSRPAGIVFAVILSAGLIGKVAEGAVYLLQYFFNILEGFKINKYLLMDNISRGYNDEAFHPEILPVMALLYLALGTLLALFITKKKDVR